MKSKTKKRKVKTKAKKKKKSTKSLLKNPLLRIPLDVSVNSLVLLESRHVFLYEVITSKSASRICKELIALDRLSSDPIVLVINSPGGSVTDGFAIMDVMRTVKAPVITLIVGMAASMAGMISVVGHQRIMAANAYWMGHEMRCGGYDYYEKYKARTQLFDDLWLRLIEHLKKYTKLSLDDLERLRRGELWLSADEAKKKGIVEHIV